MSKVFYTKLIEQTVTCQLTQNGKDGGLVLKPETKKRQNTRPKRTQWSQETKESTLVSLNDAQVSLFTVTSQ